GNPNVQTSPVPNAGAAQSGAPPVEILSFADWVRQTYGREPSDLSDDLAPAQQAYQTYVDQQKAARAAQQADTTVTVGTPEAQQQEQREPRTRDYRDQGQLTPGSADLEDYMREVRGRTAPVAPGAATFADVVGAVAGVIDPYVAARSAAGGRQASFADIL